MRQCPVCGAQCVFSRAESLEDEDIKMKGLAEKLAGIVKNPDPQVMAEAKDLLEQLYKINRRWNISSLDQFLKERQRELFP
jgi:hypothetical protein